MADWCFIEVRAALATGAFLFALNAGPAQQTHMHDEEVVSADEDIGTVDFQVSCEGVGEDFDRALGLMHHMMYEQARAGFEAIAGAGSECAMAYWGVATTLFQPLWSARPSGEDLERGWRNIQRARDLRPESERDRLLVEATAGFFREPESAAYRDRINRWAEGMAAAYQANPQDLNTAALYGLSRLALAMEVAPENRDALHDEAEKVLREVWEAESEHPGAIHYSIHATDVDGRAENALDLVEAYGEIAPTVPHSLHMPSHIYVRLGDWPAVINWNRRSAEAALREPVNDAVSHHYIHAMDYLLYAYLQQGEDESAREVHAEVLEKQKHQPTMISTFHMAAMPARQAVERRDWEAASAIQPREPDYLPWDQARWPEGLSWFTRGLGAVNTGDLEAAGEAEARLKALRDEAKAAGEDRHATYIDVDRQILASSISRVEGEPEEAVRLMHAAAELEETVEKDPLTPGALLPPYEALGALFMDLDRPGEALEAYRDSDEIWPGRFNTLLGAARAARAAGEENQARDYYARLLEIAGESRREGVAEARGFLKR